MPIIVIIGTEGRPILGPQFPPWTLHGAPSKLQDDRVGGHSSNFTEIRTASHRLHEDPEMGQQRFNGPVSNTNGQLLMAYLPAKLPDLPKQDGVSVFSFTG
ncbi:hypothetical protein K440DRAFT_354952 [Wilcoxina mikolae CBS 423.85]|nr:hypothetical protein K440DRAFT_354952 [Wilcoxina mikolae CBS 423.85]